MLRMLTTCDGVDVRFFSKGEVLPDIPMARTHQVHGNRTVLVDTPMLGTEEADGMTTKTADLALVIRIADCQNFAFYCPETGVLGALHAGWRGLINGAIENHIDMLKRTWQADPHTLWVAAGPSLCQRCAEFTDPSRELPGIDPKFFSGRHVDLRSIADQKLLELGIRKDHIERHPDCTRCNRETYWSYRAEPENVRAGSHNFLLCRKTDM